MSAHESNHQSILNLITRPRAVAFALKQTFLSYRNWKNPYLAFRFFLQAHSHRNAENMSRFHLGPVSFYVRPIDWFAFEEIISSQEYRFITTLFQKSSPEIIIDLGANVGLFSLYALSLWSSAQVHSLEPNLSTYNVLHHNQKINPGLNWHTYQYAVWEQDGEISFETGKVSTSSRVMPGQSGGKVPAITLDTFFSKYVNSPVLSLVKIDIEGAEEAVLRSSTHLLGRIQNLVIEVHPEHCDQDYVISVLRSSFKYLYQLSGRRSGKPLLLACRDRQPFLLCCL